MRPRPPWGKLGPLIGGSCLRRRLWPDLAKRHNSGGPAEGLTGLAGRSFMGVPDLAMIGTNHQIVDCGRRAGDAAGGTRAEGGTSGEADSTGNDRNDGDNYDNRHSRQQQQQQQQQQHHKQRVLLTCEHASNELPAGYSWGSRRSGSRGLRHKHWAFDPGARDLTVELAEALGAVAVLSRVSRLFIDVNRPPGAETLCRALADGEPVELNEGLSEADRLGRIKDYWIPYHLALGKVAAAVRPHHIVSCHSYAESYEGEARPFHVGVLCTGGAPHQARARAVAGALADGGFSVRMNEPWSGHDGFMYSADSLRCSAAPGERIATMLEVRNDVLQDPAFRRGVVECIAPVLAAAPEIVPPQED